MTDVWLGKHSNLIWRRLSPSLSISLCIRERQCFVRELYWAFFFFLLLPCLFLFWEREGGRGRRRRERNNWRWMLRSCSHSNSLSLSDRLAIFPFPKNSNRHFPISLFPFFSSPPPPPPPPWSTQRPFHLFPPKKGGNRETQFAQFFFLREGRKEVWLHPPSTSQTSKRAFRTRT